MNERIVDEIISGNTPEEFLTEFQKAIKAGFSLKSVPPTFGMGIWQVEITRTYSLREQRYAANKITVDTNRNDFTKEELQIVYFHCLSEIAKRHGVKVRSRQQMIRQILLKQEEL